MISQADIDAAPRITLAGKQYAIPLLVPRQQRIVLPLIVRLVKSNANASGQLTINTLDIGEELFDDLVTIVSVGLSRAHPEITRDAVLDMETNVIELIGAVDVIMRQSGVFKPKDDAAGEAPAGQVSKATDSQTGTQSSPA